MEKTLEEGQSAVQAVSLAPTTASPPNASNEKQEYEASPRDVHGIKWILACAAIYITAFLFGLDTTIAADVQASVIETFGNVSQLSWVGAGFPLGSVSVILAMGALYSKFNVKWIFITCIAIFEVGSAVCGAAPTMNALIVGRVIAGVGGAGVYMGALNLVTLSTTNKERGLYIAGIGLIWGLGCILGPVIGGAFSTSNATWRWAFYINLPICAVFVPVYFLYIPSVNLAPDEAFTTKLLAVDFVGIVLFAGFVASFAIAFTFGGSDWAWSDGRTIALLVVFGVLLLAFIVQQYFSLFTRGDRIFPGHLLKSRTQILAAIGTSAASSNLFIPAYYIPIFFQFANGDTPILAAVRLLPFVLVLIFVNMVAGALLPVIGYYWTFYVASGVLMTIGGALMVTVTAATPTGAIYGFTVLLAIGCGITVQAGYAIASVTVATQGRPADIPNAIMLQNVSQLGATLIALVISGQVFQSVAYANLARALAPLHLADAELRSAVAGAQSAIFTQLDPVSRRAAVDAVTAAIQRVWILTLVAGVVTLLISPWFRRVRLMGMGPTAGG